MAKGYNENQARLQQLSAFGKDLARRSKSTCELSGATGVPLKIYEIPPVKEPDFDRCLFITEETIHQLDKAKNLQANQWRHLNELIWSDIPAVQLMSARILLHLASKHPWAQDVLDTADLDPEIIAEANAAPLK